MRQITITPSIEKLAERYEEILTAKRVMSNGLTTLNVSQYVEDLKAKFEGSSHAVKYQYKDGKKTRQANLLVRERRRYSEYLKTLKEHLDNGLLKKKPSEFDAEIAVFRPLLTDAEMSRKMKLPGMKVFKSFKDILLDKMCYSAVRSEVFPEFVKAIGIHSCVYCNTQYAITDEENRGYYQLDHWKPESTYPFLSVCFFNLQPSCATCNLHKSKDLRTYHSIWQESTSGNNELYRFSLTNASLARYIMTHHCSDLKVELGAVQDAALLTPLKDKLHVDSLYNQLTDVAEEVVWKRMAYDQGYATAISRSGALSTLRYTDVNRFVLGTYDRPEDIHKRPMAKLTQDVAKLGIL